MELDLDDHAMRVMTAQGDHLILAQAERALAMHQDKKSDITVPKGPSHGVQRTTAPSVGPQTRPRPVAAAGMQSSRFASASRPASGPRNQTRVMREIRPDYNVQQSHHVRVSKANGERQSKRSPANAAAHARRMANDERMMMELRNKRQAEEAQWNMDQKASTTPLRQHDTSRQDRERVTAHAVEQARREEIARQAAEQQRETARLAEQVKNAAMKRQADAERQQEQRMGVAAQQLSREHERRRKWIAIHKLRKVQFDD